MANNLKQLLVLAFIYVVVLVGCYYFIPLNNEEELALYNQQKGVYELNANGKIAKRLLVI